MPSTESLSRAARIAVAIGEAYGRRLQTAVDRFNTSVTDAGRAHPAALASQPAAASWQAWFDYLADAGQRSVLFWDTLRQRGNNYVEHKRAGMPPLLHFDYSMVVDGRTLSRPVNYALVSIVPPRGVEVDPRRRPYVIIDPRAGHGPGIGGFKDDSQVGVALEDGHPVYFVIFFPEPVPGQTLIDVCNAEREFIHVVRERHPESAAPVVVGNCQGGWAAMMLAASVPEETGPVVVNGAPLSYWGGAWSEGAGDNPMRYTGGLYGGSWPASFAADLGGGVFDGADLVQNFENLNPANTFWNKYYNLFARVDTERERFLEFERWWGGFFLMDKAEIEWIVQNLFVGNRLAEGQVQRGQGEMFDLRQIRAPIVIFASLGDNITPPQQAFNWVADLYGSTEEIKARGQVIVGLLHENVGHLGIFVSGQVARREHKQIVSVLKSIEALPPGLWGMEIDESTGKDGKPVYAVSFVEHRLEDVAGRLNRYARQDEEAFEAVATISEFNQRAYDLFARPLVRALTNPETARVARDLHPLRAQRWAISDLNPWTWWLAAAARQVEANRHAVPAEHPLRQVEQLFSAGLTASLDLYRDLRDAAIEAQFFAVYGNLQVLLDEDAATADAEAVQPTGRDLPWVADALAAIDQGGYAEAVARTSALLRRNGGPLPLSQVELRHALVERYADLLPALTWPEMRRVRGRQDLIVTHEPELALATLPSLLGDPADRDRFLALLDRVVNDPETPEATPEQAALVQQLHALLEGGRAPARARSAPARRTRATPKSKAKRKARTAGRVPRGGKE